MSSSSASVTTDKSILTTQSTLQNLSSITPNGRHILLAITGGIAAYKSAVFARLLIKAGFSVQVIMTHGGQEFITPLTLQALTSNIVHTELLDATAEAGMGHIELAKWADLMVIVPASANTLARLASGMADDLLATVCLATDAPVIVAPAMNQQMWAHPAVQYNVNKLSQFGYQLVQPASGIQACGDVGAGRLPEPEELLAYVQDHFKDALNTACTNNPTGGEGKAGTDSEILATHTLSNHLNEIHFNQLKDKRVTITAGPTIEAIDPVRFLSNHSTGKMGFALAQACQQAGAIVTLIVGGKVSLPTPDGVTRVDVLSAVDMLKAADTSARGENGTGCDVFIATAAVADYRTKEAAPQKIKKTQDTMTLELVKNPDILATISHDYPDIFMVGFAAETQDVERYAKGKLAAKKLDMIACNDVSRKDIGFASNDNAVTVYFAEQYQHDAVVLDKASKQDIAEQLVVLIGDVLD